MPVDPVAAALQARPFDLQVNGYGGVDFNQDDLTADDLSKACKALRADGVAGILATVITESMEKMCRRLARLVELCTADRQCAEMIRGLHIEGPFLSAEPGYRGAHPPEVMGPADVDQVKRLLEAGSGWVKVVTLAPERDPGAKATRLLARQGVVVSAGHTDASRDQLAESIDQGLSMFTHLGNGCPMTMHRHDNIIQRALSFADRLWLCFIADGAHVPFFALRNYLELAGIDRCIVTTDAVAPAGLGPGRYTLSRWDLTIGEDLVARAPDGSHLVGSAINFPRVIENLTGPVGLTATQAQTLISRNPRKALGIA